MKLILKKLTINNFKGIKSLVIDFDVQQTGIFAANEVGKTTISDAWHWLLTGKNSADQKDFNIKNTVLTNLNRADHEVSAVILADNSEVILKKIYREKWVKKRGEETAEFAGHETLYFFDDVPKSQAEYEAKINGMLPENVLKMITNPLFFNSNTTQWGWRKRREVLLAIGGNISNTEVFDTIANKNNKTAIDSLLAMISKGKTMEEYKTQIASNKTRIKNELKDIPPRIDELTRSMPEPVDEIAVQKLIDTKQRAIEKLDEEINDKNKGLQAQHTAVQERQTRIHELTTRRSEISYQVRTGINNAEMEKNTQRSALNNEVVKIDREIKALERIIADTQEKKVSIQKDITALRANWKSINDKEIVFDDHAFSCPTCQRAYETGDVEEMKAKMTENYNNNKAVQLERINNNGVALSKNVGELDELIANTEKELGELQGKLAGAKTKLSDFESKSAAPQFIDDLLANNDEYIQLGSDIQSLQAKNNEIKAADHSEAISQKTIIHGEIDELKKELNTKEVIDRANNRIKELNAEENALAQQLADLEKTEFLIEDFTRSKMDILESRINCKFEHVKFKLFDRQINGGEVETCETMYLGVPFSDLNTAGKIWAGIDIINTLSSHYGVSAPIFLDNRESVTNIPETKSQVINLVVSAPDKTIRIAAGEHELLTEA